MDYYILKNSIWPNGLKKDEDEYAMFYPLGTNKVDISTITWPKGDALVSPFVYQDDKLVGFVDTKALTTDSQTTIYLPYEHIEAEFLAIDKGQLQIHSPKGITKKASWKDGVKEDIPEVQFKYKGCANIDNITTVDANYQTTDIVDGVWSEPLWDLEQGGNGVWHGGMFYNCTTLTSFSSDLPNLTNGYDMFDNCSQLSSFSSDLSNMTKGGYMFYMCSNLTSFDCDDLSNLTSGHVMFYYCSNLTSFNADLSSLTDGKDMFYDCSKLASFSSNLSSLRSGSSMFHGCTALTSFNCNNLSNLISGDGMFNSCSSLESFSFDLPNLLGSSYMFYNCSNLTSFNGDLSSLTSAQRMFYICENLTSFNGDLSSLKYGDDMFNYCKLDAPSVKNIIDTINTYSGKLTIGMGCDDIEEDADLFAQEVGYVDMTSLLAAFKAKGWTVYCQCNGRPATTYGLRRPTEDTLPVFVQLEETEDHVDYTSEDGSKKYILNWFHETTGSTEGYTQYASLEEAIKNLNIKPIERNQ